MTGPAGRQESRTVSIETENGLVAGRAIDGVAAFLGIPYAEPPVGKLRWRPPVRLKAGGGSLEATTIGPAPIQELPPASSLMYRLNFADRRSLVMSEDCLYLNVFTPEPTSTARLPVLLWFHGGAFRLGHGGQDLFDGHNLAARGLVVVAVNTRLGALGFLSHPELAREDPTGASGNYGLHDAIMALAWLQDNIVAFGGDPSKVTIAGNSAGAATVNHLMAVPAARGLFRAAIGQSAAGMFRAEGPLMPHDEAARRGADATASLGRTLDELRDLSALAFAKVQPQGIVIDGSLVESDTTTVFLKGEQAGIPLLAGWNDDEGSLYATRKIAEDLESSVDDSALAADLRSIYPLSDPERGASAVRALVGDRRFAYPVWRWACTHAVTARASSWLYRFDHDLPVPDGMPPPSDGVPDYGSFHTSELPFVWDNLDAREWAWRPQDRALASRLADTWARFVASGDPSGGDLPRWDTVGESFGETQMTFGSETRQTQVPRLEAFRRFDQVRQPPAPPIFGPGAAASPEPGSSIVSQVSPT